MKRNQAWVLVAIVSLSVALEADTIVMRDGQRVQGQLFGIRDGIVS